MEETSRQLEAPEAYIKQAGWDHEWAYYYLSLATEASLPICSILFLERPPRAVTTKFQLNDAGDITAR